MVLIRAVNGAPLDLTRARRSHVFTGSKSGFIDDIVAICNVASHRGRKVRNETCKEQAGRDQQLHHAQAKQFQAWSQPPQPSRGLAEKGRQPHQKRFLGPIATLVVN